MMIGVRHQWIHREVIYPKNSEKYIGKYQAELPCDIQYIEQIHWNNIPLLPATQINRNKAEHPDKILVDPIITAFSDTTQPNGFPLSVSPAVIPIGNFSLSNASMDLRYFIDEEGILNFLFDASQGELFISYLGIPVDEENIPLLLEDIFIMDAILAYVKLKVYEPIYLDSNNFNGIQYLSQTWAKKKLLARGNHYMPGVDERESLMRIWMRMIPNSTGFDSPNGFGNINSPINRFF